VRSGTRRGEPTARILVIEDNPTNLQLVVYLLHAFGHEVSGAREGAEGIEMARQHKPDLILLDIHMPKMDGYEVARRLREDPDCCRIPIVAVTALAMVGDREKLLTSGFDGYISKPIEPETFSGKVQEYLGMLPRNPESVSVTAKSEQEQPPSVPPSPKRTALLFVDNTAANIHLAQSLLEPLGYEILTAASAREGMEVARRTQPDLIVSDVHMPHEDGYDFHSMVQGDPNLADIPFIFLSSSVWSIREKETALERGALKFISRPIESDALVAELEACLPPPKVAKKAQGSGT
jgi:two-component system, cell cycle response regulator